MQAPTVSVVMPTFRSERRLEEAIQSIRAQSFGDLELIIVADEPTRKEEKIIEKHRWHDKRIIPVYQDKRQGLVNSLNTGFKVAQGKYIARMDADDISIPERIEKQVQYLDQNPRVGILGTGIINIVNGKEVRVPPKIENASIIASTLVSGCAISHPSVMFRGSFIRTIAGPYQERFRCAEDIDLWIRCIGKTAFHNLPDYLLVYRPDGTNVCSVNRDIQAEVLREVKEAIARAVGLAPQGELIYSDWLHYLYEQNNQLKRLPELELNQVLADEWYNQCLVSAYRQGLGSWREFWLSPLSQYISMPIKRKIKFLGVCLIRKKFREAIR